MAEMHMALSNIAGGFSGTSPPSSQDNPARFFNLFHEHASSMSNTVAGSMSSDLRELENTPHSITPFVQYGCVLIAFEGSFPEPGSVNLLLLSLDGWRFSIGHDGSTFWAQPGDHAVLDAGTMPSSYLPDMLSKLHRLLAKAELKKADARSSKGGERQGHQKTPAFIYAIVQDALFECTADEDGSLKTCPRGGLTDVGLHTGGKPRETSWPLARAVLSAVAERGGHGRSETQAALAFFELLLAQHALSNPGERANVDDAMRLLSVSVDRAVMVIGKGHDLGPSFEEGVLSFRRQAEELIAKFVAQQVADSSLLPLMQFGLEDCRFPIIGLAGEAVVLSESAKRAAIYARRNSNLGALGLLCSPGSPVVAVSCLQMKTWLAKASSDGFIKPQLALQSFETWVFERIVSDNDAIGASEVAALEGALDSYRVILNKFIRSSDAAGLMQVELRSREVLATWSVFCLTDRAARSLFELLQDYGVSLNMKDLRHLVLSDKLASDALFAVGKYLVDMESRPPIFSLRSDDATLSFAEAFSRSDAPIEIIRKAEAVKALGRKNSHWDKVQRMQVVVRRLQVELNACEQETAIATQYQRLAMSYETRSARTRLKIAQSCQRDKLHELESAKKAPPPVVQPLPESMRTSRLYLFFMHAPPALKTLIRMSFTARQTILPRCQSSGRTLTNGIILKGLEKCIDEHFNQYRNGAYSTGLSSDSVKCGLVKIGTREKQPVKIGPSQVLDCTSPEDGVWLPTSDPILEWRGGGVSSDTCGDPFDPFRELSVSVQVPYFTEKLQRENQGLQWALHTFESSETRADRGA
jgi:hypothetical protein